MPPRRRAVESGLDFAMPKQKAKPPVVASPSSSPPAEVGPPVGKRVVARSLFLRSSFATPADCEAAVQACASAIRRERQRPWIDRSDPGVIRVGHLPRST